MGVQDCFQRYASETVVMTKTLLNRPTMGTRLRYQTRG